jgi:hypothetical protein
MIELTYIPKDIPTQTQRQRQHIPEAALSRSWPCYLGATPFTGSCGPYLYKTKARS